MQKAKQAAQNFLSKDGKHKTTVDQDVRAGVTEEHVKPHEHEKVTTAIDKEVHQDHHQTRVQPLVAHETLPETSSHSVAPVQHKTFDHGNDRDVRSKLDTERAAFTSSSTTHDTSHSTSAAPVIGGERVHHHVHEHIQPVVHKETIAPHTVHKTIPVHETHHAAPIHHEVTTLPTKSIDEFNATGALAGKNSSTLREFDGCPGPHDKERGLPGSALHQGGNTHSHATDKVVGDAGYTHSQNQAGVGSTRDSHSTGSHQTGGLSSTHGDQTVPRAAGNNSTTSTGTDSTTHGKPSLMEKINPKVDSNGDGKAGFMK